MNSKLFALPSIPLTNFIFIICFFLWSCDGNDNTTTVAPNNVLQVVSGQPAISTFTDAINRSGIGATLTSQNTRFTIFAPTNDAFSAYLQANGYSNLDQVPAADLTNLVNYHITLGRNMVNRLDSARLLYTLSEARIFVFNTNNTISLNGEAQLIQNDIGARNGVVHIVDQVLTPPTQTIGQFITSRANAENPEFSLLQTAIQRAGLSSLLNSNNQPYTFFAPTDAAFTAAGYATAEDIENEDPAVLQNILYYHLLPGYRFSFTFINQNVASRQGSTVAIDATNQTVKGIGNAEATPLNMSEQDVLAVNGIVHAIDQVLLPE